MSDIDLNTEKVMEAVRLLQEASKDKEQEKLIETVINLLGGRSERQIEAGISNRTAVLFAEAVWLEVDESMNVKTEK